MKKLKLFIGTLIGFMILSCSSDDDCNNTIEPIGNEFTANCNRFSTPLGRLNINHSTESETASCQLQFTNNTNGNGFNYGPEDNNINLVDLWLIIPAEYTLIDEIPEGTYTLENNLNSAINEQYVAFDVADWNRVIIGASIEGNSFTGYQHLYGTKYDDITVNVSKDGNTYSIDYIMIYQGKSIKGSFVGPLEVVDTWL
jgi:hypothetical protein